MRLDQKPKSQRLEIVLRRFPQCEAARTQV